MQDNEVAKNTVLRVQRPIYVFLLHPPLNGHLVYSILSAVVSSTMASSSLPDHYRNHTKCSKNAVN